LLKTKGFFLAFLLVFGVSQATFGAEVKLLSLEEALTMGIQSTYEIKMAKLRLDNASFDYEQNKALNMLTTSKYSELQLELKLIQAEANYRQTKDKVLFEIAQKYVEMFKVEQEKRLKSKQVEIEEKSLRDLEIQVEKGYKTRLELLQQENKYHITLLALKKIEDNYQQLTRDFETKIGLEPGELGIELKDIATPTSWSLNEEEAIVLALKNSLTLQALTLETELAKIDLERAKIGPLLALEQKKLENNLELALLNQEQSRAEVKRVVGNQYASLRQVEEELALNRTHLEIVKKNYQLVQQLQAADLISLLDQISAEVELLQAEYQMRVAITGFYLEKWKLQQLIGLELEV